MGPNAVRWPHPPYALPGHGFRLRPRSSAAAEGLQGLEHRDDARRGRAAAIASLRSSSRPCTGATAQRAPPPCRSTLHADDHDWYSAGAAEDRALKDFAAVMMRKDPPFDMEYVYSTYLLEAAEREGARVFNRPRAIRDYNEKFAIAAFRAFTAPTLVYARCGADRRVHRRARRRDRQAARRHGRHVGVPRARRRSESQRHRRDRLASRRALGDGAALHSARSPKATSASC